MQVRPSPFAVGGESRLGDVDVAGVAALSKLLLEEQRARRRGEAGGRSNQQGGVARTARRLHSRAAAAAARVAARCALTCGRGGRRSLGQLVFELVGGEARCEGGQAGWLAAPGVSASGHAEGWVGPLPSQPENKNRPFSDRYTVVILEREFLSSSSIRSPPTHTDRKIKKGPRPWLGGVVSARDRPPTRHRYRCREGLRFGTGGAHIQ